MNRQERRAAIAAAKRRGSWAWEKRLISAQDLARFPACADMAEAYLNDTYSVQVYQVPTDVGLVEHLIVRRHDGTMPRAWADLQRIKDELVGAERTAVQVFPAAADVVDQAPLAHLWVLPAGVQLPFGLHRGEQGLLRVPAAGAGR